MATLNPYLNFDGNCKEAFDFYKSVFGGELSAQMKFKEMAPHHPVSPEESDLIMHTSLPIGKDSVLMGSDRPKTMGESKVGDNFTIAIAPDNFDEATRLFNSLSVGGQVFMPFEKAFWGDYYGDFSDKFGVRWLVNYREN